MPLTPAAFDDLFRRLQACPSPIEVAALTPHQDSLQSTQALAFAWAEEQGLLIDLVQQILNKRPTEAFVQAATNAGMSFGDSALQKLYDPVLGFVDAGFHIHTFPKCASQVCRVLIDGKEIGTGFLIRPRVVATAHHVISGLLDHAGCALPGSHARLQFEFGHAIIVVNGAKRLPPTHIVNATQDWLEAYSEAHQQELVGGLPGDPNDLAGHFDFALIRLESVVKLDLEGLPIETEFRLAASEDEPITIIQHPKGSPLRHDRNVALRASTPDYRVEHRVNTEEGSSGAPCLNGDARVVAIHQSGPLNGPGEQGQRKSNENRCVPIHHLTAELNAVSIDTAGLIPIHNLSDGHLVIGRSQLVEWLYATLRSDARTPPILIVQTDGVPGLRFTNRLMQELLPVDSHVIHYVDARDFDGLESSSVIDDLVSRFELQSVAENRPLSTAISHMRRNTIEMFLSRIDEVPDRHIWLVLDYFDRDRLGQGENGSLDMFDALFQKLDPGSRLRIVLLNRGEISPVPTNVADARVEQIGPPSRAEVELILNVAGYSGPDSISHVSSLRLRGIYKFIVESLEKQLQEYPRDRTYYRRAIELLEGVSR